MRFILLATAFGTELSEVEIESCGAEDSGTCLLQLRGEKVQKSHFTPDKPEQVIHHATAEEIKEIKMEHVPVEIPDEIPEEPAADVHTAVLDAPAARPAKENKKAPPKKRPPPKKKPPVDVEVEVETEDGAPKKKPKGGKGKKKPKEGPTVFRMVSELSEGRGSGCEGLYPCGPDGCPGDNAEHCEVKCLRNGCNTFNFRGGRCHMKKCEACTKESCEYTTEDGGFDVFTALKDPAARPEEPEPEMAGDLFMSTLAEARRKGPPCKEDPVAINGNAKRGNLGFIDCPSGTCPPESCQIHCEGEPLCKFLVAQHAPGGWDCTAYSQCTPMPLKWEAYEKEMTEDLATAQAATEADNDEHANLEAKDAEGPAVFRKVADIAEGVASDCFGIHPCGPDGCPSNNVEECELKTLEHGANTFNYRANRCYMKKCDSCEQIVDGKGDCEYTDDYGGFDVYTTLGAGSEKAPAGAENLFMATVAEQRNGKSPCEESPVSLDGNTKKGNLGFIDCPSGTCPPESCQAHCEDEPLCTFVVAEKAPGGWDCTAYDSCTPPSITYAVYEKEANEETERANADVQADDAKKGGKKGGKKKKDKADKAVEEETVPEPEAAEDAFGRMDANDDGVVDRSEWDQVKQRLKPAVKAKLEQQLLKGR